MSEFYQDALVLQAPPNWSSEVTVEWEFKTDIFEARDGTESRRALREKPRRRMDYTVTLTQLQVRELRTLFARHLRRPMAIADFTQAKAFGAAEAAEIDTIPFDGEIPYWIRTGEPIAFITRDVTHIRQIVSTIDNILVLDTTVPVDWTTRYGPPIRGRIAEDQSINKPSNTTAIVAFNFAEDPTSALDPIDPLTPENVVLYREFPVFALRPNWASPPKEVFSRKADTLDFNFGAVYELLLEDQARWSGTSTYLAKTQTEAEAMAQFFFRRKGRLGSFYCPTWQEDVRLAVPLVPGTKKITVEGTEPAELFGANLTYRNLALVDRAGMWLVGVTKAEVSGSNTILTLDVFIPDPAPSFAFISWLIMVRFGADQLSFDWRTNEVSEFEVTMTSLFDRFFELQINGDRITFSGDYVTMPPHEEAPVFVPFTISGEKFLMMGDYIG